MDEIRLTQQQIAAVLDAAELMDDASNPAGSIMETELRFENGRVKLSRDDDLGKTVLTFFGKFTQPVAMVTRAETPEDISAPPAPPFILKSKSPEIAPSDLPERAPRWRTGGNVQCEGGIHSDELEWFQMLAGGWAWRCLNCQAVAYTPAGEYWQPEAEPAPQPWEPPPGEGRPVVPVITTGELRVVALEVEGVSGPEMEPAAPGEPADPTHLVEQREDATGQADPPAPQPGGIMTYRQGDVFPVAEGEPPKKWCVTCDDGCGVIMSAWGAACARCTGLFAQPPGPGSMPPAQLATPVKEAPPDGPAHGQVLSRAPDGTPLLVRCSTCRQDRKPMPAGLASDGGQYDNPTGRVCPVCLTPFQNEPVLGPALVVPTVAAPAGEVVLPGPAAGRKDRKPRPPAPPLEFPLAYRFTEPADGLELMNNPPTCKGYEETKALPVLYQAAKKLQNALEARDNTVAKCWETWGGVWAEKAGKGALADKTTEWNRLCVVAWAYLQRENAEAPRP